MAPDHLFALHVKSVSFRLNPVLGSVIQLKGSDMRFLLSILTAFITFVATPVFALDNCLIGVWRADAADLAHVIAAQMNGAARVVGGSADMQIAPSGDVNIIVNNLTFEITVPNVPQMDVSVNGYSTGFLTADDGAWVLTGGDYNLAGSADVLGQTMTIPFTSASGIFGGGLGEFGCSANSLSFESAGDAVRMPRHWTR